MPSAAFWTNASLFIPKSSPEAFASGCRSKDCRTSDKMAVPIRRIKCKADGSVFSIQPSFVMPYLTGYTDEVANPLFLRTFRRPLLGPAQVFGRDASYWQRLETSLGRNSIGARWSAPRWRRSIWRRMSITRRSRAKGLHRHHRRGGVLPGCQRGQQRP